ncbi:MAG TPA: reverse transcriptase family protein [Cytophagaceae bacterium]|jgi:RNA-directed DNA polymerase|nr:reverse transcriptase family protein [Cytophagaceae bacterium]
MIKHSDLDTLKDLANYLRCEENELKDFLTKEFKVVDYSPDTIEYKARMINVNELFNNSITLQKMYIPKKNKKLGFRIVFSVKSRKYSNLLKTLNTYLKEIYSPSHIVHGFVENRNIKTNASQHLAKKYLLSIDIKDFFETIDREMIHKSLIDLGFKVNISEYISQLVTFNNKLVQGYNTSPTIANIVAQKFDAEIITLCKDKAVYTRYADDLYFSSNNELPKIELLTQIVNNNGFSLNNDKTKYMYRGGKQFVTGLSVFDKNCPRVPNRIKKNLRLEIYHIKKWGVKSHILKKMGYSFSDYSSSHEIAYIVNDEIEKTYARINGWIQFIKSIELNLGMKLHKEFTKRTNYQGDDIYFTD